MWSYCLTQNICLISSYCAPFGECLFPKQVFCDMKNAGAEQDLFLPQACNFSCLYSLSLIYLLILGCSGTEGAGSGKCSGIWAALSSGTLSRACCLVTPGCSIHIPISCSLQYKILIIFFFFKLLLLFLPSLQHSVAESQWQSLSCAARGHISCSPLTPAWWWQPLCATHGGGVGSSSKDPEDMYGPPMKEKKVK